MDDLGRSGLVLPDTLHVEAFAQARIQELELLDAAVAAVSFRDDGASAGGLRHQAEALPRHMRRRTTSHNPRRMPVALKNANATARAAARKGSRSKRSPGSHQRGAVVDVELPSAAAAAEGEKVRCRKHRRRPRAMLVARSPHADGLPGGAGAGSPARWLETHIWHAKRMHMGEMWGFKLPIKSNRGRRAAVEAALDRCTLQDVTFLRPIEIRGPLGCLLGLLSAVTDPLDDRPKRPDCVKGSVEAPTHLYRVNEFPLGCIAPITIMWSPPDPVVENQGIDGARESDKEEDCDDFRRAWLWVHPAAAEEAFQQMMEACALEGAPWAGAVEAGPVAGGLNRLRVRGSRAHAVVQRVLRTPAFDGPVAASPLTPRGPSKAVGFEEVARENAEHWRALCSPSSVAGNSGQGASLRPPPPGSLLSITVLDPRERVVVSPSREKFGLSPPVTAEKSDSATGSKVTAAWREWSPRWAAVSPLWDPDARALSTRLAEVRRDHVLNEDRRRERERDAWDHIGGRDGLSPPPPSSNGRGIAPVMIVASSPSPADPPTRDEGQGREGGVSRAGGVNGEEGRGEGKEVGKKRRKGATVIEAGWDLILSAGWASAFFSELVMAGARAISLEDADGLALEAGKPRFPADFPDTASGRRHWDETGHESRAVWARTRPKHRGFVKPQVPHGGTSQARADPTPASRKQTQAKTESRAETEAEARDALRAFRPDFRLLASGAAAAAAAAGGNDGNDLSNAAGSVESGVDQSFASLASIQPFTSDTTPLASVGGQEREESAVEGDDDAAQSPSLSVAVGESKSAAREFEKEPEAFATARGFHYVQAFLPGEGTAIGGDGEEAFLPPPLQLAFPTVLEVVLRQRKGVPKAGALIHPASPHHHDLWLEGERDGAQPWPGFGATAPPPPVEGVPHRASTRLLGGSLEQVDPAMGAVTSGGFSFLRGSAVGRGVCEAVTLRDAMFTSLVHGHRHRQELGAFGRPSSPSQGWALVLVGNEAGSWFRPAVVEVVA